MFLTYTGDVRENIIGRLMGPTGEGKLFEAIAAEYLTLLNLTRVEFREVEKDDPRSMGLDENYEWRIIDG